MRIALAGTPRAALTDAVKIAKGYRLSPVAGSDQVILEHETPFHGTVHWVPVMPDVLMSPESPVGQEEHYLETLRFQASA